MPMEVRVASKWQISSSAIVWLGMTTDSQKTPFKTFPVDIRDNHNMFLVTMELEFVPWAMRNIIYGKVAI